MTELLALNLIQGVVHAVALDGSRVRTLVDGLNEAPDGIVVDHQRGHIYWTNMGTPDPGSPEGTEPDFFIRNGSIERVDFDGTNRRTIIPRGSFTTGKQLTADFTEGKLYWCDREGMQVLRCNLDGSSLEPLVVTGSGDDARDTSNWCVGIALDPVQRMIYWTQKGAPKGGEGRIFRAPISIPSHRTAADRDDIELLWSGLPEPIDLELAADGTLVWTDRGAGPRGNTLNRARVEPEVGDPLILSHGYKEAIGLASVNDVTYYVSDLSGSIRVVDLGAGTDSELVQLGPSVTGIALADL